MRPITQGPQHHFFGYYDKEQWDETDRFILGQRVGFLDRSPEPSDTLQIGIIDSHDDYRFTPVAETRAWCWQQGCMLQWLPGRSGSIVFNDRIGDRFVAIVLDTQDGTRRVLPRPIYAVSPDGKHALSLNFSRLADTRPGYGYAGLPDIWAGENIPRDDGIYSLDIGSGDHRLLLSLDRITSEGKDELPRDVKHWVNHLLFNPRGDRFIFLHRWVGRNGFQTRFCTASSDGDDVFVSSIKDGSHFIWKNNEEILIWANTDEHGPAYYIVEDRSDVIKPFGKNVLNRNGHCTYMRDEAWILTDEYPDQNNDRPLILYHAPSGERSDVKTLHSPPALAGELRCDLHPRCNRSGTVICVDSAHEGSRQMYTIDVSTVKGTVGKNEQGNCCDEA